MAEVEFEVSGRKYRARSLDAFTQYHIIRRLGPLAKSLASSALSGAFANDADMAEKAAAMLGVADYLAVMPQPDADYVLREALKRVQFSDDGSKWHPLTTPTGDLMQADLPLSDMVNIVLNVLTPVVSGFFSSLLPQASDDPPPNT